jgi:hypothetical protein
MATRALGANPSLADGALIFGFFASTKEAHLDHEKSVAHKTATKNCRFGGLFIAGGNRCSSHVKISMCQKPVSQNSSETAA